MVSFPCLENLQNLISDVWLCITVCFMMTIKGCSNKACAACKYQRRRCSKECPLAPYFPSDQPKKFSNAHRLFGVANVKKILDQVEPMQRDEAMKSIIFESDMREQFPVMGCLGVIWSYHNQILALMEELRHLKLRLAVYKEHFYYHISQQISPCIPMKYMPVSADTLSLNEGVIFDDGGGGGGNEVFGLQQSFNSMTAQSSNFVDTIEYDDVNPYDVMVDDRLQLFIEYKEEPCQSSKESSLREEKCHIERGSTSELKSAATYLGLTSVK